ncbi:MAG TPA: hypothetical protein DIW85_12195, partial [Stenotrophomonas sp.]|nr:hypothetical protein [Stenotrophomonas sp.]
MGSLGRGTGRKNGPARGHRNGSFRRWLSGDLVVRTGPCRALHPLSSRHIRSHRLTPSYMSPTLAGPACGC